MDTIVSIEKIINKILLSSTVDEKRLNKNNLMAYLKEDDLVQSIPVAVRLNTEFAIGEAIDSFMVHDNSVSRENLNNTYANLRDLLLNDIKAA
jgi:hypothetical protein|tara:strand:- start:2919 stop:3197 length:279 start_codon:yes stop_codon:yes gene_type:complete